VEILSPGDETWQKLPFGGMIMRLSSTHPNSGRRAAPSTRLSAIAMRL
jgi:hypothetical protein